ncbi:MAG: ATP synthase F1 subunit epsilon [candidate division WOR-3 bacterium]|nr:ATP synthase F1 subunit epsilon [candidate division WOR-3 bacterium]
MKTLQLDLVTPRERVYRGVVRSVAVPAWKGEMGVLPGHAPYLSLLVPGRVTARTAARQTEHGPRVLTFNITGGCVEVLPDRVTILADSATQV